MANLCWSDRDRNREMHTNGIVAKDRSVIFLWKRKNRVVKSGTRLKKSLLEQNAASSLRLTPKAPSSQGSPHCCTGQAHCLYTSFYVFFLSSVIIGFFLAATYALLCTNHPEALNSYGDIATLLVSYFTFFCRQLNFVMLPCNKVEHFDTEGSETWIVSCLFVEPLWVELLSMFHENYGT